MIITAISTICVICVFLPIDPMAYVYKFVNMEYISRYMGLFDNGGRSFMGIIFDIPRYVFFIYAISYGIKTQKTQANDNIFALAICLIAIFIQTNGLLARIIYYVTIFMAVYIPYVLIENGKIYNRNLYGLFLVYVILSIYGCGQWGCSSLTSGYYLMF
jgi:hypothetical protein